MKEMVGCWAGCLCGCACHCLSICPSIHRFVCFILCFFTVCGLSLCVSSCPPPPFLPSPHLPAVADPSFCWWVGRRPHTHTQDAAATASTTTSHSGEQAQAAGRRVSRGRLAAVTSLCRRAGQAVWTGVCSLYDTYYQPGTRFPTRHPTTQHYTTQPYTAQACCVEHNTTHHRDFALWALRVWCVAIVWLCVVACDLWMRCQQSRCSMWIGCEKWRFERCVACVWMCRDKLATWLTIQAGVARVVSFAPGGAFQCLAVSSHPRALYRAVCNATSKEAAARTSTPCSLLRMKQRRMIRCVWDVQ